MSKIADMQRMYHHYKDEAQVAEVKLRDLAEWAVEHGWPKPKPIDPMERLAEQFGEALRQETRYDEKTKRPYRANHAVTETRNGAQLTFWIDIDEAPRKPMHKSLVQRREQIVGDCYQLTLDMDHWNSIHPEEDPIMLPVDFTFDVDLRKNIPMEVSERVPARI